MLKRPVFSI